MSDCKRDYLTLTQLFTNNFTYFKIQRSVKSLQKTCYRLLSVQQRSAWNIFNKSPNISFQKEILKSHYSPREYLKLFILSKQKRTSQISQLHTLKMLRGEKVMYLSS